MVSGAGQQAYEAPTMDAASSRGPSPPWHEMLASEMLCPICLRWMASSHACVPCGHIFCSDCLLRWLMNSPTCPCCRSRAIAPVPCLKLDVLADLLAPHFLSSEERNDRNERTAQSGRSSSAFQARWRDILIPGTGAVPGHFQRPGHEEDGTEPRGTRNNLLGFIVPPALEGWSFRLALPAPEPVSADAEPLPQGPGPALLWVPEHAPQPEVHRPLLALPGPGLFVSRRTHLPPPTAQRSQPHEAAAATDTSYQPQDSSEELPQGEPAGERHPAGIRAFPDAALGEAAPPGPEHSQRRAAVPPGPFGSSRWPPEVETVWLSPDRPPSLDVPARLPPPGALLDSRRRQSGSLPNIVMPPHWQALRPEPGPSSRGSENSPHSTRGVANRSSSPPAGGVTGTSSPAAAGSPTVWPGETSEEAVALISSAEVLAEAAQSPAALEADVAVAARGFAEALAAAVASSGEALVSSVGSVASAPSSQEMLADLSRSISLATSRVNTPRPPPQSRDEDAPDPSTSHSTPPTLPSASVGAWGAPAEPEAPLHAAPPPRPSSERVANSQARDSEPGMPHFSAAPAAAAFPVFPVFEGRGRAPDGSAFRNADVAPGAFQLIPFTRAQGVDVRWRPYVPHETEPTVGFGPRDDAEERARARDVPRGGDWDQLSPRRALDLDRRQATVSNGVAAPYQRPEYYAQDAGPIQVARGHTICLCPACLARASLRVSSEGPVRHSPPQQAPAATRRPRPRLRLRNALLALLPLWAGLVLQVGIPAAGHFLFPGASAAADVAHAPAGWEVALLGP
eukprot:jgi/Botrbrau1/12738/Bobra.67_1s0097.1